MKKKTEYLLLIIIFTVLILIEAFVIYYAGISALWAYLLFLPAFAWLSVFVTLWIVIMLESYFDTRQVKRKGGNKK